jgi:pilus assembly protein CpaB
LKPRGFVITVAAVLAILATGAVYLYVRGVQNNSGGASTTSVIVAKEDIAVGTKLDDVIAHGGVTFRKFPKADVVRGAVTDIAEIKGRLTSAPIVAGEQITSARLAGSSNQPTGGALGIPQGYEAVTISLQAPQAGGGEVHQGDHVSIYATFSDITVLPGSVRGYLAGKFPSDTTQRKMPDFITTIAPDVQVLKVLQGTISATNQQANIALTLALKPDDAARVLFADQKGTMWIALLPPNQQGQAFPPAGLSDLIGPK